MGQSRQWSHYVYQTLQEKCIPQILRCVVELLLVLHDLNDFRFTSVLVGSENIGCNVLDLRTFMHLARLDHHEHAPQKYQGIVIGAYCATQGGQIGSKSLDERIP